MRGGQVKEEKDVRWNVHPKTDRATLWQTLISTNCHNGASLAESGSKIVGRVPMTHVTATNACSP